jgi:hypothetical protein
MLGIVISECHISFIIMLNVAMLSVVMLNVVMLSDVMLNVVMLSVVMLNVVAPLKHHIKVCIIKPFYDPN